MAVDIDGVFKEIGEFGKYQKFIYFLLCLPAIFVSASNMAFVFIAATPNYRCLVPKCDVNFSDPIYKTDFVNFTIPVDPKTHQPASCVRFDRVHNHTGDSCRPEDYTNVTVGCPEGKVFDQTVYLSTVVSEFNLTCSDKWEGQAVQSIYFGGVLVGSMLFGMVADLIGRKITLIICVLLMATTGLITSLVSSFTTFNIMRFLNAALSTGVFQCAFVLGVELVGSEWRVLCGVVNEYFYALGEIILAFVAWGFREWRMTQMIISVPVSVFVFYWRFVPESPRWLQSRGKQTQVNTVLEKIARKNGKPISAESLSRFEILGRSSMEERPVNFFDILKTPLLCIRMFAMFFIWIVTTLLFYGLSLNMSELSSAGSATSRPYINFILAALVEFPGYTLALVGMMWWGRRNSLALSMILGGIACIAAGFTAEYSSTLVLIPALFGKCCITCGFAIIFVFASEMFPTSVRGTILGMCSMWARVGGMLAPFSDDLAQIYSPLPMLVFGGLSILAGALNIVMPETLGTKLPDTIQDAINLGRYTVYSNDERQHLLRDSNSDDNYGIDDTSNNYNTINNSNDHNTRHRQSPNSNSITLQQDNSDNETDA